ncbi:MAG: GGDEF domain-containing protein [Alcanivoracaceae bacterium]|jgi:diguanylate cyclase (GGDEF)-like protein|nr:GGDEF domain-containing protein [Alcanivoracaceae bacterium]
MLKINYLKLLALVLAANLSLLLFLATGTVKAWSEIQWMDMAGEGGSMAFVAIWVTMLLISRPQGRVTSWLFAGLALIFISMWLDFIDEFIKIPDGAIWDNWLESAPMPVGLILLTIGLYHWHHEQQAINRQMQKRERIFREHRLFDRVTPLSGAEYLRRQLTLSLNAARNHKQPLSLIVFDIDDFSLINHRYGMAEGDRVLESVTQLALLNLRHDDLLCRLAGDRFVVILPNTGERSAAQIADEIKFSIEALSHKIYPHGESLGLRASATAVMALEETSEDLLERLNISLAAEKQGAFKKAWPRSA